ncbi:hypothetical protein SAMN05421504_11727 [Amycolatopsis xylanica]|uniref:Deferrochelatase/peroxidase EfeB n=1 Tax=Amycolatopsis xylanica TaxID=589385 RepID=A0A1H3T3H4_9PSEU|nr:hypothetical protein [Amycolatopsis xylanica]SDZ44285.1 hypothetical protein SAMN05421504_11727 [Amycolatopsis xylanica]
MHKAARSRCPLARDHDREQGFSIVPVLTKPVTRRTALRRGGTFAGAMAALGTLDMLGGLARVPVRTAWAEAAFPDVQFDLAPFMPPAKTIDGVAVAMPPVHTTFVTARLTRAPSKADCGRMETALRTIEANYPYAPGGVFTHVAYSDNYFNRLPAALVAAAMPRTLAGNQPVLKRAVPGPTDVAPGSHELELRRPEFHVPVRMESNDLLFTVRGDDPSYVADVVAWLGGSGRLVGRSLASPRFDAGMTVTSTRAMFVQIGLPRFVAAFFQLPFASFVNPFSPMWMGFADQQVDASSPAQDVTFLGGHGIRLSNAKPGDYFDTGSIQHLSHVLLDLQQFYVDGREPEEEVDHRENFDERLQYMLESPSQVKEDPRDPFRDGGGPRDLLARGAFLPNVFRGADYARTSAERFGRMGHLSQLHRSGRTADGRPIHLRIDGPGFDAMDTTTGRNTPKLQFSGFFPSADFFAELRRSQASVDLLEELDLEEEDHGLERFITATRRQNFLVPPRRHRGFPLVELT